MPVYKNTNSSETALTIIDLNEKLEKLVREVVGIQLYPERSIIVRLCQGHSTTDANGYIKKIIEDFLSF